MIKSSILALVAVAAMGSVAAPAFAENNVNDNDRTYSNYIEDTNVLGRLQEQGVNASSVESWGTLVRAYVTQADGSQVSQLFNRDTLKPVTL